MEKPDDVMSLLNWPILIERYTLQLYGWIHTSHVILPGPSSNFHSTVPTESHSDSQSTVLSVPHTDLPSRTFTLPETIWDYLASHVSTSQTCCKWTVSRTNNWNERAKESAVFEKIVLQSHEALPATQRFNIIHSETSSF